MAKLRKKAKANEDKCKKMFTNMTLAGNPTKLEPRLFVIVDTDELQKQTNRLENRLNHMERVQARNSWVNRRRTKKC